MTLARDRGSPGRRAYKLAVSEFQQLYADGRLNLAPEFQRNSVWPSRAKSYLIDTLLADRPTPVIFLERQVSAQTGRETYSVIDGQQRLRAILDFLKDGVRLTETSNERYQGLRYSELTPEDKESLLSYELIVEELVGYSEDEIRDVFVRLNRFVVRLAPQELRHAAKRGAFSDFVEQLGRLPYWFNHRIFSRLQIERMRPVEFSAELTILILEGPQDKKQSIDLYYEYFVDEFPDASDVEERLADYFEWTETALEIEKTRFRRPVELYGLVGALHRLKEQRGRLPDPEPARRLLEEFDLLASIDQQPRDLARYLLASSRQTDNLAPRQTRIEVLEHWLEQA
ncbi:MAG: DUF262 domain-containing protein [Actinomycetota bacterium]|nr:DUF262 domain-containing protein [Actinomycetota bacterium]